MARLAQLVGASVAPGPGEVGCSDDEVLGRACCGRAAKARGGAPGRVHGAAPKAESLSEAYLDVLRILRRCGPDSVNLVARFMFHQSSSQVTHCPSGCGVALDAGSLAWLTAQRTLL